jgi:hypothetical protein
VPTTIRKDLWSRLATVTFPQAANSSNLGLKTFQKLREFRKLHETAWDPASMTTEYEYTDKEDPAKKKTRTRVLSRKERGRKLCDQKANSVADLSAALKLVTTGEAESLGDVLIQWNDVLDAEFAESWPTGVVHAPMEREVEVETANAKAKKPAVFKL